MNSLVSSLYGAVVAVRRFLYRKAIFSSYKAKIPVISIGNISAGGTGKTPFTIFLASRFSRPAVLIRGYKSAAEHSPTPVIATKETAALAGDEAALLAKHIPHGRIYVGKKRAHSASIAEKESAQVLLLDDGFQHFQLQRDLDIVLIDCSQDEKRFQLMREPFSALRRADLVVLTRAQKVPFKLYEKIKSATKAPIVRSETVFKGVFDREGVQHYPEKVALFCGLGNPQQFYEFVQQQGIEIVAHHFVGDHETIAQEKLQQLHEEGLQKGATAILCTEKDLIKLQPSSLPVYAVAIEMQIALEDRPLFDEILTLR